MVRGINDHDVRAWVTRQHWHLLFFIISMAFSGGFFGYIFVYNEYQVVWFDA